MRLTLKHRVWVAFWLAGLTVGSSCYGAAHGQDLATLDRAFWIRLPGALLKMPRGYLAGWPKPNTEGEPANRESISFAFWMPSLRFVEIPYDSIVGARPKEKNRAPSPDTSYVVRVTDLRQVRANETGYVSPEQSFLNLTDPRRSTTNFEFTKEVFGLTRFSERYWPHKAPRPFVNYVQVDDRNPQVILRCIPPELGPVPFPLCDGRVHFAADDVAFHVQFPREFLSQWRDVVSAAHQLFEGWKVR